jgi:hypothetical protein
MYNSFEELEGEVLKQGKTNEAKNLLKSVIDNCKKEKKSINETFSAINQLIINPNNLGVC